MERMNKEQLLKLIETVKVDREEFWVLSSGALTLRGIYPDAGDLDIAVTDKGLEQLKENYDLKEKGNDWYTVTEQIECVCDGPKSKLEYQPENIDGIYVQNIYQYLEFLKGSEREKDKQRIGLVEEYIKSQYEDKER